MLFLHVDACSGIRVCSFLGSSVCSRLFDLVSYIIYFLCLRKRCFRRSYEFFIFYFSIFFYFDFNFELNLFIVQIIIEINRKVFHASSIYAFPIKFTSTVCLYNNFSVFFSSSAFSCESKYSHSK